MLIPLLEPGAPSEGLPLIVSVRGSDVALEEGDEHPDGALFIGTVDGRHVWAVDADGLEVSLPFANLMGIHGQVDESTWAAAGRAVQLVDWSRSHRFCGRCGTPTEAVRHERARRCPACGLLAFPRLAPAVIMLVERDDGRVLLARNARWPNAMYSCLAGFVEPGETLEQAVKREVAEEVGIDITNLRYFASQPWPFPHSLMLGFNARYAGGDIAVDGHEIADAQWFGPGELPDLPGRVSIARRLIDDWVNRSD